MVHTGRAAEQTHQAHGRELDGDTRGGGGAETGANGHLIAGRRRQVLDEGCIGQEGARAG